MFIFIKLPEWKLQVVLWQSVVTLACILKLTHRQYNNLIHDCLYCSSLGSVTDRYKLITAQERLKEQLTKIEKSIDSQYAIQL